MQTLYLKFPARRYHATPWGHHVNEGLIEWPPSPWRLLRALLAAGYTSGLWNGDGPGTTGRSLIQKLAGVLPSYRVPPASGAHSRHYMPIAKLKAGQEEKTMVFDTWAHVDGGTLVVQWDITLSHEESALLSSLAERLGYLGRSESWVVARLAKPAEGPPEGFDCYPSDGAPLPGWEQVSLIAPFDDETYAGWRKRSVAQALLGTPEVDRGKGKLSKEEKKTLAQREKIEAQYPPDLIACLQVDTTWLRQYGWSQPPGSRKVLYQRPLATLETCAPRQSVAEIMAPTVESMLLSISTAGGSDHALPPIARTLPQAELLHRALVSFATKNGGNCPVLCGCDAYGKPLRGPHDHAHILPLDLDGDKHLDHILIWAQMGLDGVAQRAIRAVRRTYTKGGVGPLGLALVGVGSLGVLCGVEGEFGERLRRVVSPFGGSRQSRSSTPFVPPRYMKKNGRNTLHGQVVAELASRGIINPVSVKIIDPKEDENAMSQRHFVRVRRSGPKPLLDCGFSLELVFAEPVNGPICLGYGSHFGMGLFIASEG